MNAMQLATRQLKLIWAVERMLETKRRRTAAQTAWLNQYYKDEAVSDRNSE